MQKPRTHKQAQTNSNQTTITMSLLTVFITDLLEDDPHRSFEILDDNAKVPSEDQFLAAYDASAGNCTEPSDDELETTSAFSPSSPTHPASPRRPMHYDFNKQFHSSKKPTKRVSRWDTTTLTLEKTLCTPRRFRSPSPGGNTGPDDTHPIVKQDLELRMPLRSLPMPLKLACLPCIPQDMNQRPLERKLSSFDIVEKAISMCNDSFI